jgi:hypothetical protein
MREFLAVPTCQRCQRRALPRFGGRHCLYHAGPERVHSARVHKEGARPCVSS